MGLFVQWGLIAGVLAPACRQQPPPRPPEPPITAQPGTLELRTAQPALRVIVPPATAGEARDALLLQLLRIQNPAHIAFGIRASLEPRVTPGRTPAAVTIGLVSPFPADSPGTFLLRASDAWTRLGAGVRDSVSLLIELVPGESGRLPQGLQVMLGGIAWRAMPAPKPQGP